MIFLLTEFLCACVKLYIDVLNNNKHCHTISCEESIQLKSLIFMKHAKLLRISESNFATVQLVWFLKIIMVRFVSIIIIIR